MMGIEIALTGLVGFCFSLFVSVLAKMPPKQETLFTVCAVVGFFSTIAIPVGLVIAIWQ